MVKNDKIEVAIKSIREQLYELSQKDFSLFVSHCEMISDSLSEELEHLYGHENIESICEILEDEYFLSAEG